MPDFFIVPIIVESPAVSVLPSRYCISHSQILHLEYEKEPEVYQRRDVPGHRDMAGKSNTWQVTGI